jgi:hypothetical protein
MTDILYTKKSLASLLKTTRETLSFTIKRGRLSKYIEIVDQRYNKVTLKLTVPFEEFNEHFQAEKAYQIKNASIIAMARMRANKAKLAD